MRFRFDSFVRGGRSPLLVLVLIGLQGCVTHGGIDLSPDYEAVEFVVPDSWQGASPFVVAQPSDDALRSDWWAYFDDPVLNELEAQAIAANPDLEAAAERFLQARDAMMAVRSQLVPHVGLGAQGSGNRQSDHALFRGAGEPNRDRSINVGGLVSWEPDFWGAVRNETRMQIYGAQERAAEYALARLSIAAELASEYFTLRGIDAKNAIYLQTIQYYQRSLDVVTTRYQGRLASELDVARAQYQVRNAEAERLALQAEREVTEHAIAVLVNRAATVFHIEPRDEIIVPSMQVPTAIPSTLLQRRPDVAAMEREMAQANRSIGIARAAFFPSISFNTLGGFEAPPWQVMRIANGFWSYGSIIRLPVFDGGYRRAQLQRSWSSFRETEDNYRSTVLNAFREVENGLSKTRYYAEELERRKLATEAAQATQRLSTELFQGGLASSLELIYSQVNTLNSRLSQVDVAASLLRSVVGLIRALGGGWSADQLPADGDIQPFGVMQYWHLDKPEPAGGIDVDLERTHRDLTQPPPPPQQEGDANPE